MADHHGTDKRAAFTGLLVTAAALFALCFGIVKMTNAKFAGHEGAKSEATAPK